MGSTAQISYLSIISCLIRAFQGVQFHPRYNPTLNQFKPLAGELDWVINKGSSLHKKPLIRNNRRHTANFHQVVSGFYRIGAAMGCC